MGRAIWLQTATVFWVGGGNISPSYCMFNDDIQTEIHTAEPIVPEPRVFEFELATEELKCQKTSGIDQIPTELIKTGGRTICYQIDKLTISIWNKDEFPEEWESRSLSVGKAIKKRLQ